MSSPPRSLRQLPAGDTLTLFSSSWKDRLSAGTLPGARVVDARVPVAVLNAAWHRLGWPPDRVARRPDRHRRIRCTRC